MGSLSKYVTSVVPKNERDLYSDGVDYGDWHYVQFTLSVKNGSSAPLTFNPQTTVSYAGLDAPVTYDTSTALRTLQPGNSASVPIQALFSDKDRDEVVSWVQALNADGKAVLYTGHLPKK